MKEIVIKIPDKAYDVLTSSGVDWLGAEHILNAVANGKVLPKGHGRLIDADALNRKDVNCANVPMNFIDTAPTIIEADKGEE